MTAIFIDRRVLNQERNLANRQKFIRRVKKLLLKSIQDLDDLSISDINNDQKKKSVKIRRNDVEEPEFRFSKAGVWNYVLSGNPKLSAEEYLERKAQAACSHSPLINPFTPGDTIDKPPIGKGKGKGASSDGDSKDDFLFEMDKNDFLDLFFEDLELPNLRNTVLAKTDVFTWQRMGFTTSGNPANMDLRRTMRNSFGRRIALKRPKRYEIENINEDDTDNEKIELLKKYKRISYIDPMDLRYRYFEQQPQPTFKAVVFFLMDVSASMDRELKDIAKRFFMLFYFFLSKTYPTVDVVFIRHTHKAEEVDEHEFFYGDESGGTIVLSALTKMQEIILARYPTNEWNIYCGQASDGDCSYNDGLACADLLQEKLLNIISYMAYVNVGERDEEDSPLLRHYSPLTSIRDNFSTAVVEDKKKIWEVFRKLFHKKVK